MRGRRRCLTSWVDFFLGAWFSKQFTHTMRLSRAGSNVSAMRRMRVFVPRSIDTRAIVARAERLFSPRANFNLQHRFPLEFIPV